MELTTERHQPSRGLSARAELLVVHYFCIINAPSAQSCVVNKDLWHEDMVTDQEQDFIVNDKDKVFHKYTFCLDFMYLLNNSSDC